jgi:phage terminase large subunit-like protein
VNWSTACPDWERRVVAGESLVPCAPLFPDEAEASLDVFRSLRIADVAGKPRAGDVSRPWLLDFVAAVFGAYDPAAERQLIREYFLCVAKKNAKSTIAAGIMMTALIRNPRHSASFLILAPTKEIAGNSFEPAADMADAINKELAEAGEAPLFRVYRRERRVLHLGTRADLKIIAADSDTVGGTKATAVLVDELWLFGKKAGAMSMFREAMGGLAARPEGFVIYLTTMSDEAPAGEFKAKLEYARQVRDGKIDDPAFLPVIYEFPQAMLAEERHRDPAAFYVTNPNLGASVDTAFLEREFRKAAEAGEHALRDFEAKHLNVPINIGLASDGWAGASYWHRGDGGPRTLEELLERSEVVTVGIDGGGLDDLFGFAVIGRERETRRWLLWAHALTSPEGMERRKVNGAVYQDFIRDGDLTVVVGLPDDLEWIKERVALIQDSGKLAMVGADTAGIGGLVDVLAEIGVTEDAKLLTGVRQGIQLMNATKTIERKLVDGSLKHSGSRLMAWCAGNAKVRQTSTAVLIERAASGFGKIDPLMAAFDAAHLMVLNPQCAPTSPWDDPTFSLAGAS